MSAAEDTLIAVSFFVSDAPQLGGALLGGRGGVVAAAIHRCKENVSSGRSWSGDGRCANPNLETMMVS
jgi:hypothetical protein